MTRAAVTPGMQLRPVHDDDHPWLVDLHNDPVVLHNMTDPRSITMASHLDWFRAVMADSNQMRLIFEVDGTRVGFAKFYALDRPNRCRALGADIHKDFRGKGLAKPMWTMMLDACFDPIVGNALHRASLTTAEYNNVARKVYRDLGFVTEGRLIQSLCREGKFYDQINMYMLKSDWESRKS